MVEAQSVEAYIRDMLSSLNDENIESIVLFGSAVNGCIRENSDLDFLIIVDSDYLPETFEERMEYTSRIHRKVRHIAKKVPIDLLIYTKAEYNLLHQYNSDFICEINNTGKVIYERQRE